MIHLKNFYYLSAFITSLITLSFAMFLYLKDRKNKDLIKEYFLVILNLTILATAWLIHRYYQMMGLDDNSLIYYIYIIFENISLIFLLWTLPRFIYSLIDEAGRKKPDRYFMGLSFFWVLIFLFYKIDSPLNVFYFVSHFYQILYSNLAVVLILCLLISVSSYKTIVSPTRRTVIRGMIGFLLIFILITITDGFFDLYDQFLILSPMGLSVFNLLSLVYGIKKYIIKRENQRILVPTEFSERFGISPRELEILELILQNKTNREIADKSFISYATVRTHLNNIYKKTGTKSRDDLISLLN